MDFGLPEQARQLVAAVASARSTGPAGADDRRAWRTFATMGLLDIEANGGTLLDQAAGFAEAARSGLPGPLLEAALAVRTGSTEVRAAVADGKVVTVLPPGPPGGCVVGWGAVADLVVDEVSGTTVSDHPLPAVSTPLPLPHGWAERTSDTSTAFSCPESWTLGAALLAGLMRGALDTTVAHAKRRRQFGRPIGDFQAVQLRLAESLHLVESTQLMAFDAAARASTRAPDADVAAALGWLWARRCARVVAAHCHQVHGALGFCSDVGLHRLTSHAGWLRLSRGRTSADALLTRRYVTPDDDPPSTVLATFRRAAAPACGGELIAGSAHHAKHLTGPPPKPARANNPI